METVQPHMSFRSEERAEGPLVSSEILSGIDLAARELAIDIDAILVEHGIDPATPFSSAGYLGHEQVTRFLQAVSVRHGCDHFGFVLGKCRPPMELGPMGRVMASSPTLGAAIENGIRFQPLFSEGSTHELRVRRGTVTLCRWDAVTYPFATTQQRLLGIVMIYRVIKALAGGDWQPQHVSLSFNKTSNARHMVHYFGCPVAFNQPIDALIFPKEDLARSVRGFNPHLLSIMLGQLEPLLATRTSRDVVAKVESYIRQTVGTGRCSLEGCAQILRTQPRTLQRQLAGSDTSFRQLLLTIRMDLACQFLRDSELEQFEISRILGYRGQSAFTRAFKRTFGDSPSQWRAREHLAPGS